jgi:hypothetical protein
MTTTRILAAMLTTTTYSKDDGHIKEASIYMIRYNINISNEDTRAVEPTGTREVRETDDTKSKECSLEVKTTAGEVGRRCGRITLCVSSY